jgi:hypothetical protein
MSVSGGVPGGGGGDSQTVNNPSWIVTLKEYWLEKNQYEYNGSA